MKNFVSGALVLISLFSANLVTTDPASAQVTKPLTTCCDPVLSNIDMATMFSQDLLSGGNLTSNYGLLFNPTAAYQTALDNSAFMVAISASTPLASSWLVLEENTDTRNIPNDTWPTSFSTQWSAGTGTTLSSSVLAWAQASPGLQFGSINPISRTMVAPSHMRPDGTIYMIQLTYWLYVQTPRGWVKQRVYCNDMQARYIAYTQHAGSQLAPGGGGKGRFEIRSSMDGARGEMKAMSMGQASPLSPAEIAALPKQMR